MSIIFKYTLFSLQGHIRILQGHKVCTRTRYFNAWFLVKYIFTLFICCFWCHLSTLDIYSWLFYSRFSIFFTLDSWLFTFDFITLDSGLFLLTLDFYSRQLLSTLDIHCRLSTFRSSSQNFGYIAMLRARMFRPLIIGTGIKEWNIRARNTTR